MSMEYTRLGSTSTKVSRICLGTMQFGWTADEETSLRILDRAFDLGVNFIDTANIYSYWAENSYPGKSEEIIGRWFASRKHRDDIVLATKLRGPMGSGPNDEGVGRKHVFKEVKASLKRLQTDYIDLYQTHWDDQESPLKETLRSLNDVVSMGIVHYIGASNITNWRLMKALWISDKYDWVRYEVLQYKYSLVERKRYEENMKPVVKTEKLGSIPYSPLAGGFLTGKYTREGPIPETPRAKRIQELYMNERGWRVIDTLLEIAEEIEAKPSQIALSWIMQQETITAPIIGANTVEQLEELLAALDINLTRDHLNRLDQASNPNI